MRIGCEDSHGDGDMRVHHGDELFTAESVHRESEGRVIALISYIEGVPSGPQPRGIPTGQRRERAIPQDTPTPPATSEQALDIVRRRTAVD